MPQPSFVGETTSAKFRKDPELNRGQQNFGTPESESGLQDGIGIKLLVTHKHVKKIVNLFSERDFVRQAFRSETRY